MTAGQSAAQSGGDRLTDVERLRILDQAINARDRPVISGMNYLVLHQPQIVIDRSTFSAVMTWGKTLTSPIIIVLMTVLSFVTCGLYFPVWFLWSLRRNRFVQTIFIDEDGLQHWDLAPIPQAQRLLSLAILIGGSIYLAQMWHSFMT
ncbi:MAG: hypothetical protein QOE52_5794 [Mycobacterium sp.]|jgi:hypothetical protein|nr:hypothetical protein [Mycobacterium sp.]